MQKKRKKSTLFVFFIGVILAGSIFADVTVKKPAKPVNLANILSAKAVNPKDILKDLPKISVPEGVLLEKVIPKSRIVSPYVVEVLVDNDIDQDQRKKGFAKALKLVLIEESGDSNIVSNVVIKDALAKPTRYVKQYKYINKIVGKDKKILLLQVNIDSNAVSKLLQRISKVVWVDDKPMALLWLAKDVEGVKILTDESVDEGLNRLLMKKSQELGLKIMLPMLDLDDLKRLKATDICTFESDKIQAASSRYGVSVIAIGCIRPGEPGIWSGHWLLLQDDKREYFIFTGGSVENVITQALQTIANNVSNVAKPVTPKDTRLVLHVVNVNSLDQYNEIVKYLHSTSKDIKQVELVKINDSNIELAVNVVGGRDGFLGILSNQKVQKLVPNMSGMTSSPEIDLDYVWVDLINEKLSDEKT